MDKPTIEFRRDHSLKRHAIRVEGVPGLTRSRLMGIHGALDAVQDGQGWTIYLKPRCDRESAMQDFEQTFGVTR